MQGIEFDQLTRKFALLAGTSTSRRTILQGAIASGASVAVGGVHQVRAASPVPGSEIRNRNQAIDVDPLIDEIAFQLAYDVDAIFRFVADEIRYESYSGALRGPRGTLWSGAGNAVDQAQLLKALLDAAQFDCRYAVGEIDSATLASARTESRSGEPMPLIVSAAMTATRAQVQDAPGTPVPVDLNEIDSRISELREQIFTKSLDRITTDSQLITDLLRDAGVLSTSVQTDQSPGELSNHVWVQISEGTEWRDADPSIADAELGISFVIDPTAVQFSAELPDDHFHRVTFRVRVESADAIGTSTPLLEQTFRSQDLVGSDITILHADSATMNQIGIDLSGILGGTTTYTPVIVVDDLSIYADTPFSFGGLGGVVDALSGEPGGLSPNESLAAHLEVEINSPDADPVVSSRTIFDRIGDQRMSETVDLDLVKPIEITRFSDTEDGYLPLGQIHGFASVVSQLPSGFSARARAFNPAASFTAAVEGMHGIRQSLTEQSKLTPSAWLDRPNISALTFLPISDDTTKTTSLKIRADLLTQSNRFAEPEITPDVPAGSRSESSPRPQKRHRLTGHCLNRFRISVGFQCSQHARA